MSGITAVMVVRDEEFFLPLSLNNALKYADSVFVLDTGSRDSTLKILRDTQADFPGRLECATGYFGGRYAFDSGNMQTGDTKASKYPGAFDNMGDGDCRCNAPHGMLLCYRECDARNYALEQAERIFCPDWIVRMDADEVFDGALFDIMRSEIANKCIGFGTEMPVHHTPLTLNSNPADLVNWGGNVMHDPHVFAWRRELNVRWRHPENSHVILYGDGYSASNALLITAPVHFHLHRCFGPKSIYTYLYWRLMLETAEAGEQMVVPYGGDEMFANVPGINRENMYTIAPYQEHMPQLFADDGRFVVPKIVHESFVGTGKPCPVALDSAVMDAWHRFLVYEE